VAVGLSISTIRRLIQSGKLPARFERGDKGQHRYFIARADLATLAAVGKGPEFIGSEPAASRSSASPPERSRSTQEYPEAATTKGAHEALAAPRHTQRGTAEPHGHHEGHEAPSASPAELAASRRPEASGGGDHQPQASPRDGVHGRQVAPQREHHGVYAAPPAAAGTYEVGGGEAGSLKDEAAYLELAVLRERLAGAQEAVRLHAERVRGQAKDIGFLHAQLDQSREAETQLRVLLARVTAALPPPEEKPALLAHPVTPSPKKVRWWWPWGKG
jgi:hypothetical protein